jgi:hypothetical protein
MLSVSTIVIIIAGLVVTYVLWKMLKTLFILASIAGLLAGAVYAWAYFEPTPSSTISQQQLKVPPTIVEQSARWLARPIHDAAQLIVQITQDEDAFAQQVQQSSSQVEGWVEKAETLNVKLPLHILQSAKTRTAQEEPQLSQSTP